MSDDDFITALNRSVKQEVIGNYLNERRIVEEEINILLEDVSAYHGGLAAWDQEKARLAGALLAPTWAERFFALAGLEMPPWSRVRLLAPAVPLKRLKGLTRAARYQNMVGALYRDLWGRAQELAAEKGRVQALLEEVNRDIKTFEVNYDLMSLAAYLRTLDPMEIKRRKILGVNFTAREKQISAEALAFKPLTPLALALDDETDRLHPPDEVLAAARGLLKDAYQTHKESAAAYLS